VGLVAAQAAAGRLTVTFFDCGQGDAALLQTPGGKTILIDAGPREEWKDFDAGRDVLAPYLKKHKISRIDVAVLSHAHLDHIGGLQYLVENVPVGLVLDPGFPHPLPEYQELLQALLRRKIRYEVVRQDAALDWDPELSVAVLWPPSDPVFSNLNDNSLVLQVRHGEVSFLFSGDIENDAERALAQQAGSALQSTVLKVAHHGSRTSSTKPFLDQVDPRMAVISCGRNNRFRHPHPEVVDRYNGLGVKLFRTDQEGAVQIVSNGKKARVRARRLGRPRSP
jgi:competence protein ComEC